MSLVVLSLRKEKQLGDMKGTTTNNTTSSLLCLSGKYAWGDGTQKREYAAKAAYLLRAFVMMVLMVRSQQESHTERLSFYLLYEISNRLACFTLLKMYICSTKLASGILTGVCWSKPFCSISRIDSV